MAKLHSIKEDLRGRVFVQFGHKLKEIYINNQLRTSAIFANFYAIDDFGKLREALEQLIEALSEKKGIPIFKESECAHIISVIQENIHEIDSFLHPRDPKVAEIITEIIAKVAFYRYLNEIVYKPSAGDHENSLEHVLNGIYTKIDLSNFLTTTRTLMYRLGQRSWLSLVSDVLIGDPYADALRQIDDYLRQLELCTTPEFV